MQIISTAVNLQYTESSEGTEFIWNIEYIKQEGGKRKLSAFYFGCEKKKFFCRGGCRFIGRQTKNCMGVNAGKADVSDGTLSESLIFKSLHATTENGRIAVYA